MLGVALQYVEGELHEALKRSSLTLSACAARRRPAELLRNRQSA
jgi:hypothetical protein